MKHIKQFLPMLGLSLIVALFIVLTIRGVHMNPDEETLNTKTLTEEGPLELSPERGRFALAYSLIENGSFQFSLPVARFVTPDLGYINGNYVSLFPPGLSFLVMPGYIIGRFFGASQVGTFAVIGILALLNVLLVAKIAKTLGAHTIAATIAGLIFLFATPAFAYAVTLYQHHVTVFFLLSCIYLLLTYRGMWPLVFIWLLIGFSVSVDYPNALMMIPIGIYALGRLINASNVSEGMKLNIQLVGFLTLLAFIIPASFFLWTNKASYGNPLQLAGTVTSVKDIDAAGNPLLSENFALDETDTTRVEKTAAVFFAPRNMLYGLYIQFISDERGILFYTPVLFLAIPGIYYLYKKDPKKTSLLVVIAGVNILLYAMWGDPWGGWAFGSRYLIPSYAILAIFLSIMLTRYKKTIGILILFFILAAYSIHVNALGALTTNRIPPKVEAVALQELSGRIEPYTYVRNWEFLASNRSKSFIYQQVASHYIRAYDYYFIISLLLIVVIGVEVISLYRNKQEKHEHI